MSALIVRFLGGPLLEWLISHFERRLEAETQRRQISAELAATSLRGEIEAREHARAVLIAETGYFFSAARLGRLLFVAPLGVWWCAVIFDSLFGFSWNVAALPAPLDEWAGSIIVSLFLVEGAQSAVRAVVSSRRK